MSAMTSRFERDADRLNVVLGGELIGGQDALAFGQALREKIEEIAEPIAHVSIDVQGVKFVNSSGLGMLLAARQAVHDIGADLVISHPGEQLRQLLSITKLTDFLGVEPKR